MSVDLKKEIMRFGEAANIEISTLALMGIKFHTLRGEYVLISGAPDGKI